MAVAKHLDYLNRGVEFWNDWREQKPRIRPVLTGASLEDRDFSGANFVKTNLSGSDLPRCSFRNASLRYTDFSGCDLTGADFEGANLLLADLTGADLSGATGLTREKIEEARTDDNTVLPEGLSD